MKSWLQDESIKMHSAHNEKNLVVTEKVIKTLKNKIYKYLTSVLKNVYIDKLGEIVDKWKKTYHKSIKKKLADVNASTYVDPSIKSNDKDPGFQVGDHVRISSCKNIFTKS